MARKCFQGDRNRFLSFDYIVGGLVEPHRDRHYKETDNHVSQFSCGYQEHMMAMLTSTLCM